MQHPHRVLLPSLCLLAAGCDYNPYTDNGQVTVKNRTDATIVVHYETEVVTDLDDCDCDGEIDSVDLSLFHNHSHISAGDEKTLFVDSFGLWDGSIVIEYAGQFRTYDVDFDIIGMDTIWVRQDDFVPVGDG